MKMKSVLIPLEVYGTAGRMLPAVAEIARLGIEEAELLHVETELMHVINVPETADDSDIYESDDQVLKGWKSNIEDCGVSKVEYEVLKGIPWIEILEKAENNPPSLIVMGSHGKTLIPRMLLGSQTENVLHHTDVPLLILRLSVMKKGDPESCTINSDLFRRVLYLTDFSEEAKRCIPFIEWMASAKPDQLVILHVQDTRRLWPATQEQINEFNEKDTRRLAELKEQMNNYGISQIVTELVTGNAIDEILGVADSFKPTIIVMGAKGRTGALKALLGGVAEAVVHRADAHVLVVR
ncbi:universal stress protein [Methanoplanus limicola]|uniref:UspA domain-containing protein n=1 Tax=Methanoplanus limicola DSM 2279 TaxID=937775 RepID=H1Z207_9EURY|nr:universal stress protein [Methanoplanus limicola]EHQ36352.1 UspA domain-containing protein [Methanoplanus limicola DSM 2279]